ncbi:MAG: exopolysaccharide biosynthesis polyprenyl glycosylphosphotransferase [Chitinivibrionales bacterium]|nr:exopolysaccharide biosynthesis polyprenyl glycosylphosphotransferase [Chitinivibrionales bacterium]
MDSAAVCLPGQDHAAPVTRGEGESFPGDYKTSAKLEDTFYDARDFQKMLLMERQRTERSGESFLFVTVNIWHLFQKDVPEATKAECLDAIRAALNEALRDIDVRGWYKPDYIIGVVCPGVDAVHQYVVGDKIKKMLRHKLGAHLSKFLVFTWRMFPFQESIDGETQIIPLDLIAPKFYFDPAHARLHGKTALFLKRVLDIGGSLTAIILFSPFFLIIPILIKLTSKGPVIFKQERVGRSGKLFKFMKFRSMYVNNDSSKHREFVAQFIANKIKAEDPGEKVTFKIKDDPRITRIGKILRATSLDEFPQFFNVLKGDMSLVGPRPPIPYEVDEYDVWHKRRVLEVKPGITGPWQIYGRSKTTFDTMVRMDINYIKNWSLWLDIKIIIKTPLVMLFDRGAC